MQQLIDFAAVLAFLIAYFVGGDIFIATGVLMVGVTLQMILYKALRKPHKQRAENHLLGQHGARQFNAHRARRSLYSVETHRCLLCICGSVAGLFMVQQRLLAWKNFLAKPYN